MKRVQLKKQLVVQEISATPSQNNLSLRDKQFASEFLRDYNTTQAYIRAGGSPRSAGQEGHKLLKKPEVQEEILRELASRRMRAEATLEEVIGFHYELATADPRNLIPFKYGACRHCWGEDHNYQETLIEHRERLQKYLLERQAWERRWDEREAKAESEAKRLGKKYTAPQRPDYVMFDTRGGTGYNKYAEPMRGPEWYGRLEVNSAESCPECNGEGILTLLPIDMSKWTYGETLLFNGAVVRKDGSVEIKLNDRVRSWDRVAELRGFVRPRLPVRDFNFDALGDDALDALIEEAQRRGLVGDRDLAPAIDGESHEVKEEEPAE